MRHEDVVMQCERDGCLKYGVKIEDALKYLESCHVIMIEKHGEPIGYVAHKDGEAHIGILPGHRKRWAGKWLYKLRDELLDMYGELHTTCFPEMRVFVERLGFALDCETEGVCRMKLTLRKRKGE